MGFGQPYVFVARAFALSALALAAVLTLWSLWHVVALGYVNVPKHDQWLYLSPQTLLDLLAPHGEHMIPFPRLVFFIDYALFAGSDRFNTAFILLAQVAHAALFVLLAYELGFRSRLSIAAISLFAIVMMLAICQHQNFTWGFQVTFVSAFFAFTAGAYAVSRYARSGKLIWLTLAVLAGLVSAGSLASGLFALPLYAVLALVLGRWRAALMLGLVAAAAFVLFFYCTNDVLHEPNRMLLYGLRWSSIGYMLGYLGGPFANAFARLLSFSGPLSPEALAEFAVWCGVVVLLASALAVVSALGALRVQMEAWRNRAALADEARHAQLVLGSVIVFTLLSAALTAYGRGAWGFSTSSRYASAVMPLVMATALLLTRVWQARGEMRFPTALAGSAASCFLLVFAWSDRGVIRDVAISRYILEDAMMALALGGEGRASTGIYEVEPTQLLTQLRPDKSLFSEAWIRAVNRPISELATRGIGGRCHGNVGAPVASPGEPGLWNIHGHTWAAPDQDPTPTLAITDANGRVVGLGRVMIGTGDIDGGGLHRQPQAEAWQGWIQRGATGPFEIHLMVDDGRKACHIGQVGAP